jgi:hypothetical protein
VGAPVKVDAFLIAGLGIRKRPGEGLTMPEFMFRNLSVKLYPPEGAGVRRICADRTTQLVPVNCSPFQTACGCTNLCTGTFRGCNHTCWTSPPSVPIYCGDPSTRNSYCDPTSAHQCGSDSLWESYIDPNTAVVIPPGADIREELALLKANLQKGMAAVDARLEEVEKAAKPTSVEQIVALKSQLLAAVSELDQQRAQMEGGGQAADQG